MSDQSADSVARLTFSDGTHVDLPELIGTEGEQAIDITSLRERTRRIALDEGYRNTGSASSRICFINGEEGILRYRGIPIERLAQQSDFIETALLLITGEMPQSETLSGFREMLTEHELIDEGVRHAFLGFPRKADPMAILSAGINCLSCYNNEVLGVEDEAAFSSAAARLMAKIRTVAAAAYKTSKGQPLMYPLPNLSYGENFLHLMFSLPGRDYEPHPKVLKALDLFFLLHADHEQNCSTSTVRMVGSSKANLFASCAAGVCALWGPLHGGANVAAVEELKRIHREGISVSDYVAGVKAKKYRLYGFGHAVYRKCDPRAVILKEQASEVLSALSLDDPLFDIALQLEEIALQDEYFVERNLYPNVDFYSGIVLRAIGIPVNMYTVLFAIGRLPGWIAHWKEVHDNEQGRIYRPRQLYVGPTEQS